jgi:hypothetical protein
LVDTAGKTLSYDTIPGSMYGGMPVSISGSGAFDPTDGRWQMLSRVEAGGSGWQARGTMQFDPDPVGPGQFHIDSFFDVFTDLPPLPPPPPSKGLLDVSATITVTQTAIRSVSQATVRFSVNGVNIAESTAFDSIVGGRYEWMLNAGSEGANTFRIDTQGLTPLLNGPGTSTVQITPVPEPSNIVLSACILPLSVWRRNRAASSGNRSTRLS